MKYQIGILLCSLMSFIVFIFQAVAYNIKVEYWFFLMFTLWFQLQLIKDIREESIFLEKK